MDKIFLSQISSGLLVAHLALLSTQPRFLWSVSGRSLQDPVPAIQTFGNLRIHPEDQNWSPDSSTLHSLLIPGFVSFYLARLLRMHLMKAFGNAEILQLHLVEICMISMTALPGEIWLAFFLLLAIWSLGYTRGWRKWLNSVTSSSGSHNSTPWQKVEVPQKPQDG